MPERIVWALANDKWMAEQGFMEWQCATCGKPLVVSWAANCELYDTDEPIKPEDAFSNSWQVECSDGHVLLLCHEVSDDSATDTYEPPTTKQIALRLATEADVIEWEGYAPPKPPWRKQANDGNSNAVG